MKFGKYSIHYRALLKLGVPIAIGQLCMIVLAFADTMMVGRYGTNDLGAASFVNNMFNLAIIFSTGFSYGLTPIVGSLFGQGRLKEVGRTLKNGLFANGIVALGLMAVMFILYLNLDRMGQPEELMPLIKPYYLILLVSILFVLLFNAFKQFADGVTDTSVSMWILMGGNILNIFGNWVLIYGKLGMPELGLIGAGLATLFSRIVMAIVFAVIFFTAKRYRVYKEGFMSSNINKTDFLNLNRLGMPVGLQMGIETILYTFCAVMVGWLGTKQLAAYQVMSTISQLGYMMFYGMAAAVAIRVSYYKGQNDIKNVKNTANAGFHIIFVMAMLVSIFVGGFSEFISKIFTTDKEVIAMVVNLATLYSTYQVANVIQNIYSNGLRGIGEVNSVVRSSFIANILIALPVAYVFGFVFDWGLTGIWASFPFGLFGAGFMYWWTFYHKVKEMESRIVC